VGELLLSSFSHHNSSKIRFIATGGVAWSVCLLVTFVSSAKTAKPIEMPFQVGDSGAPKEQCIRWG